jgi:NAD(P)-dependent dehydrogenase (short-subunit alcohol dehydrogenase family)
MARIVITGSAEGLGRAAAQNLLDDGHEVVVHARSKARLAGVRDLIDRGASSVVGDLADLDERRGVAEQVNRLGQMDAVIHNAGVYSGPLILPSTSLLRICSRPHPPSVAPGVSQQQHASWWASRCGMHRPGQAPHDVLLLGQQALRHHPRRRRRADVVGRVQQCGRPGRGADKDGRARRFRRSPTRTRHPGVARLQ